MISEQDQQLPSYQRRDLSHSCVCISITGPSYTFRPFHSQYVKLTISTPPKISEA
ncbi:uncharacterized protein AFUA_8G01460 [Aspergillus fumigatus Af293]|uniref:Uncharacterized protein n=2 Tax=Aspergillus fumigatus TaxID=746128 RepID=Q4WB90_ASPFU|nr:hypothetical protein AFUA_8G01460 [Aspergillus fumigatus Af293]EAL85022.1 hypothetical protein AFUA_8G01460 [Aspergillus fumigatus Af293]EDP49065.1 hypothetical protein AFUB_085150 [Aspergillus fumigatus A1163]